MKNLFIVYFIIVTNFLVAQESITNLISNPKLSQKPFEISQTKSILNLPFFDDFSYNNQIVDRSLWEKSSVYVNRNYPINPPTIGVATFDGLNEYGLARDFNQSSNTNISDTLLSKEIDLSTSNSVYFMFFYQAKGIGDSPELEDLLILEFLNDTLGWEQVWNSNNIIIDEFTKVVKIINGTRFYHNAFQFRFRNYATNSGNFDHWHLDYVKIDNLFNSEDTTVLRDISFVYNSPSFLNRYFEMPWTHFLNNQEFELKDSIDILLRNNDAGINVDYQYNIFENNNQIYHYPIIGNSRNVSVFDYDSIGNFSFSNPPINIQSDVFNSFELDSTSFLVQNIVGTSASDYKMNDTLYHTQIFNSHFAYDDGSAESAYGININGAKLAYEFKLNRPDTLRAIQMYFPQMLDSVNDINFDLTIWSDNNGLPAEILYSQTFSPVHTQNGEYHTYYLTNPFKIIGTFYVGWIQETDELLNIGFDRNNEANNYMFYDVGSGWNNSSYLGSWMIRPILSMEKILSGSSNVNINFKVFPNPVTSELIVQTSKNNIISIYSLKGILLKKVSANSDFCRINIKDLPPSVYLLEVSNLKEKSCQKLIIR
jgi:hypothetical protein